MSKEVSFVIRAKDAASGVLKQVEKSAQGTFEKMFSFKSILSTLSTAAAGFSLSVVIKDIIDLGVASDKTFRGIAAALPTFTDGIAELKKEVAALTRESGKSVEEVEALASRIAHLGVSDRFELQDRLRGALDFSAVTGMDPMAAVDGIDQMMDAFGLSADQLRGILARLSQTARETNTDVEGIFDAFQKATPTFQRLGVDADTGSRALAYLLSTGLSLRQLGDYVNDGLTKAKVKEWADQVTSAGDALSDFNTRLDEVQGGTDRALERYKTKWKETLSDIGDIVTTGSAGILQGLGILADKLRDLVPDAWKNAAMDPFNKGNLRAATQAQAANEAIGANDVGTGGDLAAGRPSAPPPHIVSPEEQRKIDEAAKKLRDLRAELAQLSGQTTVAKSQAEQFAESIAKWQTKAKDAGMSTKEVANAVAALEGQLRIIQRQEAMKIIAEDAKQASEAMARLDDAVAQMSNDTVAQFDAKWTKVFASLYADVAKLTNEFERSDAEDAVNALYDKYVKLRAAVVHATEAEKEIIATQDRLATTSQSTDQINKQIGEWGDRLENVKKKLVEATDPSIQAEYRKEMEQIVALIGQLFDAWDQAGGSVKENTRDIADMVKAWEGVARSVIAAAQAMGVMDDKTASALQNLVTLSKGASDIASGNVVQGSVEVITSVAALAQQTFGLGHAASQARVAAEKLRESIDKLFLGLRQQIEGSDSLEARLTSSHSDFTDARRQIEEQLGGKKNEAERERALRDLNTLEAARTAQIEEQYKAEKAAAEFEQFRALQDVRVRLLEAQGRGEEADALREMLEVQDAVNAGRDAEYLATLKQALALEDEAKAKAKAAQEAERAADFQEMVAERMLRVQGLSRQADAMALQQQHIQEFRRQAASGATADEMNQLLILQALETMAVQKAAETQDFNDAVNRQSKILTDKLNAQLKLEQQQLSVAQDNQKALQQQHDDTKRALDVLTQLRATLTIGNLSVLNPIAQRDALREQMLAVFGAAKAGDKDAAQQFSAAAQAFLDAEQAVNASGPGYVASHEAVVQMADELLAQFGAQESIEQQALDAANAQVDLLTQQIDATQGVIQSVNDAASQLTTAIIQASEADTKALDALTKALGFTPGMPGTPGAGPAPTEFAQTNMSYGAGAGMFTADQFVGMAQSRIAAQVDAAREEGYGYTDADLQRDLFELVMSYHLDKASRTKLYGLYGLTSPEADFQTRFIQGFAGGGMFDGGVRLVGERGPELEFTGPSRILSNAQISQLFAGAVGGNREVLAELRALRSEFTTTQKQVGSETIAKLAQLVATGQEHTKVTSLGAASARARRG